LERSVHHQHITRENTGFSHGLALHTHKERGGRVLDAKLVQIESFLNVILRWGRKTRRDPLEKQWDFQDRERFVVAE
jgi:hypothetical protein